MANKTGKKSKGFFGRMFKSPEPPTLTGSTPETGQFDPESFTSIVLHFDKVIDSQSLGIAHAGAFINQKGNRQPLPGRFELDEKGTSVTFSSSDNFPYSCGLEIRFEKGFKAADGGVLKEEIILKYTTTDAPPPPVPIVYLKEIGFIPSEGAKEVSVDLSPAILFDKKIDPESIKDANVLRLFAQDSDDPLPAQVRVGSDQSIVYLSPAKPLSEGETYQLLVKGGEGGIKSKEGSFLESDLKMGFVTRGQKAETGLVEEVGPEKPAEKADFPAEKPLPENKTAEVAPLPAEKQEPVLETDAPSPEKVVREVASASNEVETVAEPPAVSDGNEDFLVLTSSDPEPGASGVSIKIKPHLTFPDPLDLLSITYGLQVKLIHQKSGELVPGFVIPKQDLTVLEIMPKMPLEPESGYEIQLEAGAGGIRSSEEKPMEKMVRITFTSEKP